MNISLIIQEKIRDKFLTNIDIDKVESLVDDYDKLSDLLSQTYDGLFNDNEYRLNTQDQKDIIAMIADEITGFGPLRELMEDDSISDIMGMEGDNVVLQNIFSFEPSKERDEQGKIQGNFINHGLFSRSAVRVNADIYSLSNELNSIFSTVK